MRIAMLSWESMHSIAVGGLAPHVTELSAALARLGHEVHVFTRVGKGQTGYDRVDGVHYHRCPFEPHPDFLTYTDRMCDSFVWRLGETEHFLGSRFDVIHGHDWLACRALRQIKNEWGRPVILTMHSTEFGRCGNCLWDDVMSRRIRDLEWEVTYLADRVICVSRTLTREVHEQYQVPADKLFSVYNGVDVAKYNAHVDVAAVRRRFEIGAEDPCVLFAGRITWQKGPDLLVEAVPSVLKQHPRAKVLFAGEGDMRPRLQDRAAKLGLSSTVRFLGHRTSGDLVGLFKSADLVCVPSRNEPFGIVILEAWSASKPVVATRIGGPAEFVENHRTGLTVEAEIVPIGEALHHVLEDKQRARWMGENGRREAESRFTWDHAALATENVYETLNGALKSSDSATPDAARSAVAFKAKPGAPTVEQIRRRAYGIYLARGGAPGNPVADWLQAERELLAEFRPETAPTTSPAAPSTESPSAASNGPPTAKSTASTAKSTAPTTKSTAPTVTAPQTQTPRRSRKS
ncbi:MAG: glycosyl transferase family 1 [Planctomycetota bacterium]|nr:MAG: glycosyl transferase family 1 [Planctomycetota bacterium]